MGLLPVLLKNCISGFYKHVEGGGRLNNNININIQEVLFVLSIIQYLERYIYLYICLHLYVHVCIWSEMHIEFFTTLK